MTRRRALAVFAAAAALLVALNALVWSLYRSEVRAVSRGLDDRLGALGATAAAWLASAAEVEPLLGALVTANRLEDAYVIDPELRVVAGVRTRAGSALNLLRVDGDRLDAALAGGASVGPGYSLDHVAVAVAYFPVGRGAAGRQVLALEAGAEYHAPATALRATYLVAVGLTVLVALVFAGALGLALRAFERTRVAHGHAERLAAVGQMAAMVAHEVRNPLGILRGQVELARELVAADAPPRERERYVEMLAEIDRLNRLTEEFLGLARDPPLERAIVELGAVATAIAGEARLAAGGGHVEVVAARGPVEAEVDEARLRQALLNLVLNATQVGGPDVRITIEVAPAGERARLTVSDDGPGVPAALSATLFEPFVGARPGGSGLGLAVARRVAERHGGTIALESAPGARGARFSIYVPRRAPR